MTPAPVRPSTRAVLAVIEEDEALRDVWAVVRARMASDPAHDLQHVLRVAAWAAAFARDEGVDERLALAAALLHDVVNLPKDHPERSSASLRSAEVAREVLPAVGFSPSETERVADAIRDHSFSRGAVPETALGRALQDADRLEALGVLGTFRCIATGVRLGGDFFDPSDPWARSRPLDDSRFSVDHFFTKLLRLPSTMTTRSGRAEAERRARTMRELLERLAEEIGSEPPPGNG